MQISPIKSRLTVKFGTSASGHKFKVIIIGQSKYPRSFKDIKNEILSCYYTADIAWMTQDIVPRGNLDWWGNMDLKKILFLISNHRKTIP